MDRDTSDLFNKLIDKIDSLQSRIDYLENVEKDHFSHLYTDGNSDLTGVVRINGNNNFAAGEGLELAYVPATGGYVTPYSRDAAAYKPLHLRGDPVRVLNGDLQVDKGLVVGNIVTDPADNDIMVDNDGRFGGGVVVGDNSVDPAPGRIIIFDTANSVPFSIQEKSDTNETPFIRLDKRNAAGASNVRWDFRLDHVTQNLRLQPVDYNKLFIVTNLAGSQTALEVDTSAGDVTVFNDLTAGGGIVAGSAGAAVGTGDVVGTNDGRFGGGVWIGTTASDPGAGQLGVTGSGRFGDGIWVGATDVAPTVGRASIEIEDTGTNNQPCTLASYHNSSSTPVAGFGSYFLFAAQSSTTEGRSQSSLLAQWVDATDASRKGRIILNTYDTAVREILRGEASGTVPMVGFLGAAAATRRVHIVDPSGGTTIDSQARSAINSILITLETFGFHATS